MDPRSHQNPNPNPSNRISVQNFSPMQQPSHQQPNSPIGSINMSMPPVPQFELNSMHIQNMQPQQQQQQSHGGHGQNMNINVGIIEAQSQQSQSLPNRPNPSQNQSPVQQMGGHMSSLDMRRGNNSSTAGGSSNISDGHEEINQYVVEALFPLIDDLCVLTKSVGRFGVKLMSMNIFDKQKFDDIMDDKDDYARVYKLYNGALRVNAGRKIVEALLTSDNYNVIQFIKENVMEPTVLMEMERIEQHLVDTLRLSFNQHLAHHSASSSAETSAAATLLLLESRGGSANIPLGPQTPPINHPTLNTELTRGSYDDLLQQSLGTNPNVDHLQSSRSISYPASISAMLSSSTTFPMGPASATSSTSGQDQAPGQITEGKVKHKRRKKAAPDEWERAKNKKLRMQGQEYMGYKKCKDGGVEKNILIVRKKRQIGPPCSSRKCSLGTYTSCNKFTDESRQNIFQNFWTRMNWEQRKTYVSSLVDVVKIKRSTVQGHESRRSSSLRYMLKLSGEKKRVCKQMFLSTLGIGSHSVHSWILKPDGVGSGGSNAANRMAGIASLSGVAFKTLAATSTSVKPPRKSRAGGYTKKTKIKTEPSFTDSTPTTLPVSTITSAILVDSPVAATTVTVTAGGPAIESVITNTSAAIAAMDSNSVISNHSNSNLSNVSTSPLAEENEIDEGGPDDNDNEGDNDQLEEDDPDDPDPDDPAAISTPASVVLEGPAAPVQPGPALNPGAHFLVKDYFDSLVKMPQEYLNIVQD